MLESDRNWVVGSDYLHYSQHISEYVKYSITTYFIHSNMHIITGYILTIDAMLGFSWQYFLFLNYT